jgi:hypothetical protein
MLKYQEEWTLSRMAHLYLFMVVWVVLQVLWPANPSASLWSSCGQWRLFVLRLLLLVSSSWLVCCLCWRCKCRRHLLRCYSEWNVNLSTHFHQTARFRTRSLHLQSPPLWRGASLRGKTHLPCCIIIYDWLIALLVIHQEMVTYSDHGDTDPPQKPLKYAKCFFASS